MKTFIHAKLTILNFNQSDEITFLDHLGNTSTKDEKDSFSISFYLCYLCFYLCDGQSRIETGRFLWAKHIIHTSLIKGTLFFNFFPVYNPNKF